MSVLLSVLLTLQGACVRARCSSSRSLRYSTSYRCCNAPDQYGCASSTRTGASGSCSPESGRHGERRSGSSSLRPRSIPSLRRANSRRRTFTSRGALVIIQETTESRSATDPTLTSFGHDTVDQRITQSLMIAFVMKVRDVLGQARPEVPLAERNDAIETFLFNRPDEPLSCPYGHSGFSCASCRPSAARRATSSGS